MFNLKIDIYWFFSSFQSTFEDTTESTTKITIDGKNSAAYPIADTPYEQSEKAQ